MKKLIVFALAALAFRPSAVEAQNATEHWTDLYNVEWTTPSKNASESMPLGGGDIGCNVWVEGGNVFVYAQRSGCFSEIGEYLKLGRIRLTLSPNPFKSPNTFSQKLVLNDGSILLKATGAGVDATLRLWVDIFNHSLHVDIDSDQPIAYTAAYENWRRTDKILTDTNGGRDGCYDFQKYPGTLTKKPDVCSLEEDGSVLFYHRNPDNPDAFEIPLKQQGMEKYRDELTNNVKHLTFGGRLFADNAVSATTTTGTYQNTSYKAWRIKSKENATHHHLVMATCKLQCESIEEWTDSLAKVVEVARTTLGSRAKNEAWWHEFWNRSNIIIAPNEDQSSLNWQMGRNYNLFRYQMGCNFYGEYPSRFNGGSFTFDPGLVNSERKFDPDWRAWGGDVFTAQNQRLLYWPMLKSGDGDACRSQFNLYMLGLPGATARVKEYFGHEGAMYCEYANGMGLEVASGWGWDDTATDRKRGTEIPFGDERATGARTYNSYVEHGIPANGYISYHWESQIEHAYMMLEYHRFTGADISEYMPFIHQSLIFFDQHYQLRQQMRNGQSLDEKGKLVIYPSTSCESYRGAKNPSDLTAGIRVCLNRLIESTDLGVTEGDRQYYREYLERLPEVVFGKRNGYHMVLPAESYIKYQNEENPQFYPLFPFDNYKLGDEEIQYFQNAWHHDGTFSKTNTVKSWHQDGIYFARMGMIDEALDYNQRKLKNADRRYPTFWGPGHDWVPDHNWGGSGMIGVQEMLLQTIGDRIHVLPAWPEDVDVSFKLHAPKNTVVECTLEKGKITNLKVTPEERMKDVVIGVRTYEDVTEQYLKNADFEGSFSKFENPVNTRIYKPEGWDLEYTNGHDTDIALLDSTCVGWDLVFTKTEENIGGLTFADLSVLPSGGKHTLYTRMRWVNGTSMLFTQEVTLPAGEYKLTADFYKNGWGGNQFLVVGTSETATPSGNNDIWRTCKKTFTLDKETTVRLGCRLNHTNTSNDKVCAFDNFKLMRLVDKGTPDDPSRIDDALAVNDDFTNAEVYNLQGVRTDRLSSGINILRNPLTGHTRKVYVK